MHTILQANDHDKKLKEINAQMNEFREKLEESKQQLQLAHSALRAATNEKVMLEKQWSNAERKAMKYKKDNTLLQEDNSKLIDENFDLSSTLSAMFLLLVDMHFCVCDFKMRDMHAICACL